MLQCRWFFLVKRGRPAASAPSANGRWCWNLSKRHPTSAPAACHSLRVLIASWPRGRQRSNSSRMHIRLPPEVSSIQGQARECQSGMGCRVARSEQRARAAAGESLVEEECLWPMSAVHSVPGDQTHPPSTPYWHCDRFPFPIIHGSRRLSRGRRELRAVPTSHSTSVLRQHANVLPANLRYSQQS